MHPTEVPTLKFFHPLASFSPWPPFWGHKPYLGLLTCWLRWSDLAQVVLAECWYQVARVVVVLHSGAIRCHTLTIDVKGPIFFNVGPLSNGLFLSYSFYFPWFHNVYNIYIRISTPFLCFLLPSLRPLLFTSCYPVFSSSMAVERNKGIHSPKIWPTLMVQSLFKVQNPRKKQKRRESIPGRLGVVHGRYL